MKALITRRQALKKIALSTATLYLSGCSPILRSLSSLGSNSQVSSDSFGPIDRSIGDLAQKQFSGDQPERAHRILWDKADYLASKGGRIPEPAERVPLVVIGGGVSGLVSAYTHRSVRPILLEGASRFGGNSRGESWQGIDYSIGAAYFTQQDEGSLLGSLYQELGFAKYYRVKETEDPVILNGQRHEAFWSGTSDPESSAQFKKLARFFTDVFQGENGREYPELPILDSSQRSHVNELDQMTFKDFLERVVDGNLHPHIETVLEHYCWSSFGASFREISAASGLNFYAAEFGGICVMPGGNARLAEILLERISNEVPEGNLRPSCFVFDVRVVDDGVIVAYEDSSGELRSIHSQAVVMACPKFVVSTLLQDIEPERSQAIQKLRYHSYLVSNVLLDTAVPDTFYDLFLAGDGHSDFSDLKSASDRQQVTDVVLGTWARSDSDRSVLTLYRGMPYDGARRSLYSSGAYDRIRTETERQVREEILPLLGVSGASVRDIRLTRWGHPLPCSDVGLLASGVIDTIRKPFRDRVFFAHQDNWMLPAMETGATEALLFADAIRRVVGG